MITLEEFNKHLKNVTDPEKAPEALQAIAIGATEIFQEIEKANQETSELQAKLTEAQNKRIDDFFKYSTAIKPNFEDLEKTEEQKIIEERDGLREEFKRQFNL